MASTPASPVSQKRTGPPSFLVIGIAALLGIAALVIYLTRPAPASKENTVEGGAPAEAKSYVKNLELADVAMHASESFMNQQLVEVEGKITNHGNRPLSSIDVYCLFYNPNGQEIHRERSSILQSKTGPLNPGQTRTFRLPFDALPEGWNQAVPRMVIAGIKFEK